MEKRIERILSAGYNVLVGSLTASESKALLESFSSISVIVKENPLCHEMKQNAYLQPMLFLQGAPVWLFHPMGIANLICLDHHMDVYEIESAEMRAKFDIDRAHSFGYQFDNDYIYGFVSPGDDKFAREAHFKDSMPCRCLLEDIEFVDKDFVYSSIGHIQC